MKGSKSRLVRSLGLLTLAAASCARLFEYPEPERERSAASCSDGEDNDFDGKLDCQDTDCDGFCPEQSAADCSDGRDNDGDGLGDAEDPRCWPHAAPKPTRCAEARGTEIADDLDVVAWQGIGSSWQRYGAWTSSDVARPIVDLTARPASADAQSAALLVDGRRDPLVRFQYNTTASDVLDENLGALVRQHLFAGSWQGFELSFSTLVPAHGLLRVAIVPAALAPSLDAPLPGAESALLALTLDRSQALPLLSLDVAAVRSSTPLPASSCDTGPCSSLNRVTVTLDSRGFLVHVTAAGGTATELRAAAPGFRSLPPSRLVFWGGSTAIESSVLLDDIRLRVKPEWPCGFAVPQVPGKTCDFADAFSSFGYGVSVARNPGRNFCALVGQSTGGAAPPRTLSAWRSSNGESWTLASPPGAPLLALPEGATLVGAGIAADRDGWHAAVAYRDGPRVELGFADSKSCDQWGALVPELTLPEDAEAPSYVLADGRRDVYFTRPPTSEGPRKLWRVSRDAPAQPPEELTALDEDVQQPVSVQLVGQRDLVLSYPTARSSRSGVGLIVLAPDLHTGQRVEPDPVFELAPKLASQEGSVAFDDRGIAAAALWAGAGGGFLMYGGISATGWTPSGFEPVLAVGTARLVSASTLSRNPAVVPEGGCGDGTCSAGETCESCDSDCVCPGGELFGNVFTQTARWEVVSRESSSAALQYLGSEPPGLNWTGGPPTWSRLPIEQPVAGDFELSFDALTGAADTSGDDLPCALYVGLGTTPELGPSLGPPAPRAGVFARVKLTTHCPNRYLATPVVLTQSARFSGPSSDDLASCVGDQYLTPDARRRVVLRRQGSQVSVLVPRTDGCGMIERAVTYTGALATLPDLLVGFGGRSFEECAPSHGTGTISNLKLQLLDDPGRCSVGKERCEPSICVDTSSSSEHCGSCAQSCGDNQVCKAGHCACGELPGILQCDGACVDSRTSLEHCGSCGHTCAERCVRGRCDVVSGDCAAPFEVPPEGGTFTLDFSGQAAASLPQSCVGWGGVIATSHPLILTWTPGRNAEAQIDVDTSSSTLRPLLGVVATPADALCTRWQLCSRVLPGGTRGAFLSMDVEASVAYRIGVSLEAPPSENPTAELRISLHSGSLSADSSEAK